MLVRGKKRQNQQLYGDLEPHDSRVLQFRPHSQLSQRSVRLPKECYHEPETWRSSVHHAKDLLYSWSGECLGQHSKGWGTSASQLPSRRFKALGSIPWREEKGRILWLSNFNKQLSGIAKNRNWDDVLSQEKLHIQAWRINQKVPRWQVWRRKNSSSKEDHQLEYCSWWDNEAHSYSRHGGEDHQRPIRWCQTGSWAQLERKEEGLW